jgi:hypothetical protein
MGTHRISESGKRHHNAFQKMECPCMHTFVFHNALHHFMLCESISTGAQNVTLDNKIKCLSLVVYLGTINIETNKKILSRSQLQFITLLFGGAQLGLHVYAVPTLM